MAQSSPCAIPLVPAFACRHTSVRLCFTDFMSMYVAPSALSRLLSAVVYSGVAVGPNELRVMRLLPDGSVL